MKVVAKPRPVAAPGFDDLGIAFTPVLFQNIQLPFGLLLGGSFVDALKVFDKRLYILVRQVFVLVTNLVDHTQLHFGFRKNSSYCFGKSLQVIDAGDENIFHTAVLDIGQDLEPEFGALVFPDIET